MDFTRGWMTGAGILDEHGEPYIRSQGYGNTFDLPHAAQFANTFSSVYKTYVHGGEDPSLIHDQEFAQVGMLNDPHLMRCVNELQYSVLSLNSHLETDDDLDPQRRAIRDGVWATLQATAYRTTMMENLSWAIWPGKSASKVKYEWRTMNLADPDNPKQKRPTRCPVITSHQHVDGDKIGYKFDGTPYIQINPTIANQIPNAEILTGTMSWGMILRGTWRDAFIIHRHKCMDAPYYHSEMGASIYGVGIRKFVYRLNWLKQELMGHILDFTERSGLGVRVWYYDAANPASKAAVLEASKHQIDKTNLLVPRYNNASGKGSELFEIKETSSGAAQFLLGILNQWNAEMELFIVGQTLSANTEGSGLGGSGVAANHADTKYRIICMTARNLEESLTEEWVRKVLAWQYPQHASMPLRWVFDTDAPNVTSRVSAARTLFDMGVDFKKTELRELTGFSDPQEGEETVSLEALQQMQQQQLGPQPGAPDAAGLPAIPGDGDGDGIPNEDQTSEDEDLDWIMQQMSQQPEGAMS